MTAGPALASQAATVIEGVTVVSPHLETPLPGMSVVMEGGRIVTIAPAGEVTVSAGARRIDGRGKWVMPGIVEFHTHTTDAAALRRALALGITTTQIIGRPDTVAPLGVESPRGIVVAGFVGEFAERMGLSGVHNPRTATEAEAAVSVMEERGIRRIKVWQDDGSLWFGHDNRFPPVPSEVLDALVNAAHARNMDIVMHSWLLPFLRQALDANVDRLIHPVADSLVPAALWDRFRKNRLVWTTTMSVLLIYGDPGQYARRVLSDPRLTEALSEDTRVQLVNDASAATFPSYRFMPTLYENRDNYMRIVQENTRAARAAGVPIVVGSDAVAGIGTHIELELMAEAGLSEVDLLSAATWHGAVALGMDDQIGTLEVGKAADMLVLEADPLADVRNWRDIHLVVSGGQVFSPLDLLGVNE